MLVRKNFHRPFSASNGKIYPPGEYHYTEGAFAMTLRRAPLLGPFTSVAWNDLETLCQPRVEYQRLRIR